MQNPTEYVNNYETSIYISQGGSQINLNVSQIRVAQDPLEQIIELIFQEPHDSKLT